MSWQKKAVSYAMSVTLGASALFPAIPALAAPAPRVALAAPKLQPKALSGTVEKGLDWLVQHQLPNGAWGQGEESAGMGGGAGLKSVGSVADTGMSALALLRSGSSPAGGKHQKALAKAVDYVCAEVESSDQDSLYVTQVRGTRVQGKIGPYIDTFVAASFLAEVKDRMPDAAGKARVEKALAKIVHKIKKNQQGDGSFAGAGWAPVLSQGMAAKGINRAAQAGVDVPADVLEKAEGYAKGNFDARTGGFGRGTGDAGVALYGAAATVGSIQDSVNTNESREDYMRRKAKESKDAAERDAAKREIARYEDTKKANAQATNALVARLDDPSFVSGFGSNGGEEFLSYMMVSEALATKGGDEWEKWDTNMAKNLTRVQNGDGSWTGHHCITGRTFCTAAALLVLMADRAPVPTVQGPAAG